MYIPGVFFSTALLFHFYEIIFNKNNSIKHFILFGLFALLSGLNQHVNALFALTLAATGFIFLNKENKFKYLITCIVTAVLYLPHLPITLYQLKIGGVGFQQGGWLPEPEPGALFQFLKVILGTGKSWLIVLLLLILCMFLNRTIQLSKKRYLLLFLFLLNYFVIYFYSVYRAPVFQYSVMLFSGTAFILFISTFLHTKFVSINLLIVISISGLLLYKTYLKKNYLSESVQNTYEYQFDQSAQFLKENNTEAGIVFFDADTLMQELSQTNLNCKITKDSAAQYLTNFTEYVSELHTPYLILGTAEPIYSEIAVQYFPYLIQNKQTQGVNYKIFGKEKAAFCKIDEEIFHSTFHSPGSVIYDDPIKLQKKNNSFALEVDSITEFPFAARIPLNEIATTEGQVVLAEGQIKMKNKVALNAQLCISIMNSKGDSTYFFTSTKISDFKLNKDSTLKLFAQAFMGTEFNKIREDARVTFFFWNISKENFEIQALNIKTIDYWKNKWNFWN